MCPCPVLGLVQYWLHKVRQYFFPFYFVEKFEDCWCLFFFKGLVEFIREFFRSWTSLFWGDLIATSISLHAIDLFRRLVSSGSVLDGYIYLEICPFLLDFPIYLNIASQSSP
jgi:hypothetical protein